MADELAVLDATAQAALVTRGEVTPRELVERAVVRIQRLNPQLNAVIHPLFEKALDSLAGDAIPAGPFHGVPFLVKDAVCHTAGDPYHLGMRALKEHGHVATRDTELARRFRAAGFVFVGKTNTPELAMSVTTEPLAYGATHNPWNPEHSSGGSSGGSAAAVAAGLVPVAHANDMGGSIRIPAGHCGLVGLKPSRARTSLAPAFGEFWGPLTHEHVLTRSVRDCAAVLDAISGPALGDPYTAPPPPVPFAEAANRDPAPLRVALLESVPERAIDPAADAAVTEAARLLESLGHQVEPVSLGALDTPAVGPWITAALARDLDRWGEVLGRPLGGDDVEPVNWLLAEMGRALDGARFVAMAEAAWLWSRELQQPFGQGFDVLLTPTSPLPPPPLGWAAPDVPQAELLDRLGRVTLFTMPFDVTGQPAISLPLHQDPNGLPIGVQLVGAAWREDQLLSLAGQIERAAPWSGRLPTIHA
jgi:amidase